MFRKLKRHYKIVLVCLCFSMLVVLLNDMPDMRYQQQQQQKYKETLYDKLWQSMNTNRDRRKNVCRMKPIVVYGLPWPNCEAKMIWMEKNWNTDPCFNKHGVNQTKCSWYKYLSEVEQECPPTNQTEFLLNYQKDAVGENAQFRVSSEGLLDALGVHENYQWMKKRMKMMEDGWVEAAQVLFSKKKKIRKRKRILVHLGLMQFDIGKNAGKSGPLGELVQWSDLLSSLYIMGYDVVVSQNKNDLKEIFKQLISSFPTACKNEVIFPYDLIYTDITGVRHLSATLKSALYEEYKCRIRIVDSFGTEALMNKATYVKRKRKKTSLWGGMEFNLKQFNTMYPHTPDNTFLGFVIENPPSKLLTNVSEGDRNIVLVYGKRGVFWKNKSEYLDIVHEYFDEIHATVNEELAFVPSYVKIHKVMTFDKLIQLYKQTKIFLGLGFPFEGPAPLEAIANGAIFINPVFGSYHADFLKTKPTKRIITSQNPYAEDFIGEPNVFTLNIHNTSRLRSVLEKIKAFRQSSPYLPKDFTFIGMMERLNAHLESQDFCRRPILNAPDRWPPLKSLQVYLANESHDCKQICKKKNLMCEPTYFPILNRKETFEIMGLPCNVTTEVSSNLAELDFPSYDSSANQCFLQTDGLLFSCAGRFTDHIRLCPCRDFIPGHVAFCKGCNEI